MPNRITFPLQPGYDDVFRSKGGMVGRDLNHRAGRVELAAKAQAGVKSGRLRRDISKSWLRGTKNRLSIRIGSSVRHATMHHEGTRPHIIRPRNARALRFVGKNGQVVFALRVYHPGTRPNQFLTDNLKLAVR